MNWPLRLAWPLDEQQYQLWSEAVLVWTLANHVVYQEWTGRQALRELAGDDWKRWKRVMALRTVAAAVGVFLLPGITLNKLTARLTLALISASTTAMLRWGRLRLARSERWHGFSAEFETLSSLAFLFLSAFVVGMAGLVVEAPLLVFPTTAGRVSAACLVGAAIAFAVGGGTHIVRGLLDKADALPPEREDQDRLGAKPNIDATEYNRGRMIGNLERVIMIALVVAGNYEGLGLLVAAKGLIRSNELANRNVAEYFIVGNLASVAVAMAIGLPLRAFLSAFWRQ